LIKAEDRESAQDDKKVDEKSTPHYLCYADLLPEDFVRAVVSTIKMNINRRPELQTIVAGFVQRDIKSAGEL
jgi:hypothetical protein